MNQKDFTPIALSNIQYINCIVSDQRVHGFEVQPWALLFELQYFYFLPVTRPYTIHTFCPDSQYSVFMPITHLSSHLLPQGAYRFDPVLGLGSGNAAFRPVPVTARERLLYIRMAV